MRTGGRQEPCPKRADNRPVWLPLDHWKDWEMCALAPPPLPTMLLVEGSLLRSFTNRGPRARFSLHFLAILDGWRDAHPVQRAVRRTHKNPFSFRPGRDFGFTRVSILLVHCACSSLLSSSTVATPQCCSTECSPQWFTNNGLNLQNSVSAASWWPFFGFQLGFPFLFPFAAGC